MAQQSNIPMMKSKSLGKDQVMLLIELISKHKVLTTRATNATNNKLKEDAWVAIAQEFSAMAGEMRRPDQLRLKWENLKKAARKRNALIRQNNIKTGGGKSYIPPDEALDRVASILGATCNGYTVEFGGDAASVTDLPVELLQEAVININDFGPLPEIPKTINILLDGGSGSGGGCVSGDSGVLVMGGDGSIPRTTKNFLFNTPKTSLIKRKKLLEEMQRARRDKDLALASYFEAKARKVTLENIKLELEIEQLKKKDREQSETVL